MINKKLVLCGILGIASLCFTSAFAHSHHHYHHPRIKYSHHHPRMWGNMHRWPTPRSYVEVRNWAPDSRYHHHR